MRTFAGVVGHCHVNRSVNDLNHDQGSLRICIICVHVSAQDRLGQ